MSQTTSVPNISAILLAIFDLFCQNRGELSQQMGQIETINFVYPVGHFAS
jgi:hypothetical protein